MASISPGRPRRYPVRFYVCAEHENRGAAVCGNDVRLRQDLLDHAVLQALSELLDERMIDAAVDRALKRLRAGEAKHLAERTQIERELGLIEHRIQRSLDAYLNGEGPMPEVRAQLGADKARKSVLVGQLAAVTTLKLDRARLQARAADVRALLGRHVPQARQMLRRILAEPIRMTPVVEGSRKGFRFEGRLAFDGLLGGAALRTLLAGTIAAGSDLAEGFIVVPFCGVAMAAYSKTQHERGTSSGAASRCARMRPMSARSTSLVTPMVPPPRASSIWPARQRGW